MVQNQIQTIIKNGENLKWLLMIYLAVISLVYWAVTTWPKLIVYLNSYNKKYMRGSVEEGGERGQKGFRKK